MPKINRLKPEKIYEKVFKKGKSFKEGFLILKIVSNNLKINRFAFIVSKKVSKKATLRNKVKRRLRELVRTKMPESKKGIDGILIASPGLETKDFQEIKKSLDKLFRKAKLIQ